MRPQGGENYKSQKALREFLRRRAGRAPSEGHRRGACCAGKLEFWRPDRARPRGGSQYRGVTDANSNSAEVGAVSTEVEMLQVLRSSEMGNVQVYAIKPQKFIITLT